MKKAKIYKSILLRIVLIIITGSILYGCSSAENQKKKKNGWSEYELKGKVKYFTNIEYEYFE